MVENSNVRGRERSGIRGPVVLVVSPHAGQAASEMTPAQALAAAGVTVGEQIRVGDLDDHHPLGTEWRAQGYQAVIAAGGDGTIGTVATQIVGTELPLGILPLGTSNDTTRALGVPLDLAAASAAIATGLPTPIDVGEVISLSASAAARPSDGDTPPDRAVFVHALTLGLNVAFARLTTDVAQRQRWGKLTYAAAAIAALKEFEPVPITIYVSRSGGTEAAGASERVTCQALQLAVVNLPLFGGALQLRVPGVQIGNGLLEVLLIEALEPPQLHTLIEGLLAAVGRLTERMRRVAVDQAPAIPADTDESLGFALPGVHRITTPSIRIETPEPVGVALDGDVRAHTPLLVQVAAAPLLVLLSVEARAALGIGQAPERNPETLRCTGAGLL